MLITSVCWKALVILEIRLALSSVIYSGITLLQIASCQWSKSHHFGSKLYHFQIAPCIQNEMKRHFQKPATESIKSCIWDFSSAVSNECNKMVIEFRVAQFWPGDTCNYQIELALSTRSFWHNSYNFCLFCTPCTLSSITIINTCCNKNSIYLRTCKTFTAESYFLWGKEYELVYKYRKARRKNRWIQNVNLSMRFLL